MAAKRAAFSCSPFCLSSLKWTSSFSRRSLIFDSASILVCSRAALFFISACSFSASSFISSIFTSCSCLSALCLRLLSSWRRSSSFSVSSFFCCSNSIRLLSTRSRWSSDFRCSSPFIRVVARSSSSWIFLACIFTNSISTWASVALRNSTSPSSASLWISCQTSLKVSLYRSETSKRSCTSVVSRLLTTPSSSIRLSPKSILF
mmetsp:Transcript_28775/g.63436  ORF Transcript_28775/g.63436 Transcript_28775/m.63436 type:complete len:204 (+) Transcript_28775:1506-2117(+)